MDIFELVFEIGRATENEIEISWLPNGSSRSAILADGEAASALPVVHQSRQLRFEHSEQKVNMVGHYHICEKPTPVLAARLSDVRKASVTFVRSKRGDAACQICRYEEISASVLDPAQARHARIVM